MSTLEGSPNQFGGFVVNPGALPEDAGMAGMQVLRVEGGALNEVFEGVVRGIDDSLGDDSGAVRGWQMGRWFTNCCGSAVDDRG